MGWKWVDEPSGPSPTRRGFGDVCEVEDRKPRSSPAEERCVTRRIVRSNCWTDEVEPGKFIRKCEKTEQLLKDCVGRPAELVETMTEHTEEDVTEQVKNGVAFPSGRSGPQPFSFPGIRADIEAIERGFLGGFGNLMDAAEAAANEFFDSFRVAPWRNESQAQLPFGGQSGGDRINKQKEGGPAFSEFSKDIKEL